VIVGGTTLVLPRGWDLALAERHAMLLERLLEQPQRLRPHAMQFPQLSGRHIRELPELGMAGRGQRPLLWPMS
jgi:hypothetical protein